MHPDLQSLIDEHLPPDIQAGSDISRFLSALDQRWSAILDGDGHRVSLFEHPIDIMLVLDIDGMICDANGTAARQLGYTHAELVEMDIVELHPERRLSEIRAHTDQLLSTGSIDSEIPVQRSDGTIFPAWLTGFILDSADGQRRIFCIMRDMSDIKRAEEALESERKLLADRVRSRTAELSAANAELGRAARLKDEFLAGMSHELRTPLNAILGVSEALKEGIYGDVTERQLDSISRIEKGGHHLLELINDVLDVAKIGAGELQLDRADTLVRSVCATSVELVQAMVESKGLRIEVDIDPKVETIYADERRLKQMLVNLLSNAVKFTEEGTVSLRVRGDTTSNVATFEVEDTGIGISESEMDSLFKPFIQLSSGRTRKHSGSGLGLSIVYHLSEMHGGGVTLKSEVGRGSRFSITLPWNQTNSSQDPALEPALDAAKSDHLDRALVVEDSPEAAEQLNRYLSEKGIETVVCGDGETALLTAEEEIPDVIILDLRLPLISGWDVLERLKVSPRTANIPVIIASVDDERKRGFAMGASEYLVKPISRARMNDALEKVISEASGKALVVASDPIDLHTVPERTAPLILIAEDNEANIETVGDYLESKGYQIEVARNGQEAVDRAQEGLPDLILMDIQMPIMNGFESIVAIKKVDELSNIPIIALTALAMPGDADKCYEVGAADYVSKPVRLGMLAEKIEALIAGEQLTGSTK